MRRKIIALALAALLFVSVIQPAAADTSGLCFTAINDTLLDLGSLAASVNGTIYVPAKIFSSLGVYSSSFNDTNDTVMLNNSNLQVYFELKTGRCYNGMGTEYSASAIYKNGQVYVPANWVCYYFGFTFSYISGVGYGDLARISSGKVWLSNQQFLDAATTLMHSRYNEYYGVNNMVAPTPTQPETSPNTSVSIPKSTSVSLCFTGIPSATILNSLDSYNYKACFFVTVEEAESSPDIIRRIYGSGHSLGIYCKTSAQSECEAAVSAIFEAAQFRPVLLTSPDSISKSCAVYAAANGFAYFTPKTVIASNVAYSSSVTAKLEHSTGYSTLALTSNENTGKMLSGILQYINAKGISVTALRETNI